MDEVENWLSMEGEEADGLVEGGVPEDGVGGVAVRGEVVVFGEVFSHIFQPVFGVELVIAVEGARQLPYSFEGCKAVLAYLSVGIVLLHSCKVTNNNQLVSTN